jgi:hypothetical protein
MDTRTGEACLLDRTGSVLYSSFQAFSKSVTNVADLVELHSLNFHTTTYQNEPFYKTMLDFDALEHALPSTILQSQPRLGTIPEL